MFLLVAIGHRARSDLIMERQPAMSKLFGMVCGAALALLCASGANAQVLPPAGKQMRLVVPYAPGGTTDILGRMLAQKLGERLDRQVIVDNRLGGGGAIGTESVVRADADGSVLLLHSGAIALERVLKTNLSYDVQRDLAAVGTVAFGPFALLVSNELPVKSVSELVAHARANPGKLNYGTPGIGSSVHLTTEQFKAAAGIDIVHVPYKGASPALAAAMANEVQIVIDPPATAKKLVAGGKLRALAVTTAQRSEFWPELPTVQEGGVAGFEAGVWFGVFMPAKTPRATVERLNAELSAVLGAAEVRSWLREQGLDPVADKPDQARHRLAEDIDRWQRIIKAAGIKAE
jgi:tripartite-type tricarboxylate transporter receptor subunit TctC